ncbi:hypothetical protein GCM10010431_13760 [Streptomyces kunmingensis]
MRRIRWCGRCSTIRWEWRKRRDAPPDSGLSTGAAARGPAPPTATGSDPTVTGSDPTDSGSDPTDSGSDPTDSGSDPSITGSDL